MKIILIAITLLSQVCFGMTVEESSIFAKYPEQKEQILQYFERYQAMKREAANSAGRIATILDFEVVEGNLKTAGLTREDFATLKTEADLVFQDAKVTAHKRSIYQQLIILAESLDRLTAEESERRLIALLEDRPADAQAFSQLKLALVHAETSPDATQQAIKLAVDVVLLRVLENLGYDFSNKRNAAVLETFVSCLDSYMIESPAFLEKLVAMAPNAKDFGDRVRNLNSAWSQANPERKKLVEAYKLSRAQLATTLSGPAGAYLRYIPMIFLPIITIADLKSPSQYPWVTQLIHGVDMGYVFGWLGYRVRLVTNFLRVHPLNDLNDKRNHGLAIISACDLLLEQPLDIPQPAAVEEAAPAPEAPAPPETQASEPT